MSLKNSLLLFYILLFIGCKQIEIKESYLIELDEFETLSKLKTTKIIDFRKPLEYQEGHFKNALNIWRTDIEDASYPYGGMKASKEQLEELFRRLGIQNDNTLIIYDDNGLSDASRFWWVLQYYNYKNVKLLNGGINTLRNASVVFTKENVSFSPSTFKFSGNNYSYYASKEQMIKALDNNSIIVDTRTIDEFAGSYIKKGAFQAGRIPSSKLLDWANAIHYDGDKKIKSIAELSKIYGGLTNSKNDTIYVYCHSGVRSAHTTFVLTQLLGYKHVLNYDGSWTEWSYYKNLPILKNE